MDDPRITIYLTLRGSVLKLFDGEKEVRTYAGKPLRELLHDIFEKDRDVLDLMLYHDMTRVD